MESSSARLSPKLMSIPSPLMRFRLIYAHTDQQFRSLTVNSNHVNRLMEVVGPHVAWKALTMTRAVYYTH